MQGFYSDEARTVMLYDHNATTGDLIATGVEVATKALSSLTPTTRFADSAASVLEIQLVCPRYHNTAKIPSEAFVMGAVLSPACSVFSCYMIFYCKQQEVRVHLNACGSVVLCNT